MDDPELWKMLFGSGVGGFAIAGLIRLARSTWLKDQAQRADLSGNLSAIGNMDQVNKVLINTIETLKSQNDTLSERLNVVTEERDDYRRKYFSCIGNAHES